MRLRRPLVLWMGVSRLGPVPAPVASWDWDEGFKEGWGVEGAGRWGKCAGAGSGRLWLEMLRASLGSASTYNKKAQLQKPVCAQRLGNPG